MRPAEQTGNLASLAEHQEQFRLWVAAFPENFADRHALLCAEMARLEGREQDAAALYEQAVRAAGDSGFVHIEALAGEFAARFYRARGIETAADAYLRRARECYLRWGALTKVKLIDAQYPSLAGPPPEESPRAFGARAEDLDALAIAQATTAISGEIELEPLLDGQLRITLEQAGAQRACLLMLDDGTCPTAAEARVVDQEIQVSHGFREEMVPAALINYVRRTAEKVVLDDAAAPRNFSGDEYFSRVRPRSALCLPIVRQSRPVAVLYLENNLSDHPFTAERSAVLDLLAAQAAISLENSRLYRSLRRENEERRKAEADLRESQRYLQAILDRSTALIFVKDANGRYLLANRRFLELFGYSEQMVIGNTDFDLFPQELAEEYHAADGKVLESAEPWELEESVSQDGELHTYLSHKFPLLDGEGKPFAVCGIATDISERKTLEEQLLRSQKLEAIGQLAGGVAHDFNNLLTVINGYSAMLLARAEVAGRAREYVEQIQGAGQRAASLTSQLLAFSRRQVLQPKVLDLNQVLRNLEKMLLRLIGENIELITRTDPEPRLVLADAGQIEQVVVNLAVNARDAMPHGGQLFLEISEAICGGDEGCHCPDLPPGRYVRLTVRDSGCGIDSETIPRIFEPFFTTKPVGRGTGLGLSTVYGIVRQSGGQVEVESEPGKGAEFRILLPRVEPEPAPEIPPGPPAVAHASETILLVEDEDNVRGLLAEMLREHGYRVIEAGGKEALRLAEEHQGPIHVMVTDVVMPHMGGVELAGRISPMHPETGVLLMSGYADRLIECKGGQSFLQKPFAPEALLERVQALCRPRGL